MLELPRQGHRNWSSEDVLEDDSLKNKKSASENGRVQRSGAGVLGTCIETW